MTALTQAHHHKSTVRLQPSGIGHSWWGDAFCPRDEDGAVGIVMTEMSNLEPFYRLGSGGGERPAVVVDEETMTVEVEAGLTQVCLGGRGGQWRVWGCERGFPSFPHRLSSLPSLLLRSFRCSSPLVSSLRPHA